MDRMEARTVITDALLTAAVIALLLVDGSLREPLLLIAVAAALASLIVSLVALRRASERARTIAAIASTALLLVVIAVAPIGPTGLAALGIAVAVRGTLSWGSTGALVCPIAVLGALGIHGFEQMIDLSWVALALVAALTALQLHQPAPAPSAAGKERTRGAVEDDRELRLAWQRRFVSMVSHDIRAPLATIRGAASLLYDHYERFDTARRQEFLETLMEGTDHLRTLVDDLLLMSQIEAGRLLIETAPVDIVEAMRESIRALLARDPGRQIEIIAQDELPRVSADSVRLRQIVTNLLGNALKYSSAQSEVIVVVAAESDGVRCTVYNEGAGISAEEQPKVFTPYATLSTRSADSTGLGLYIAKELVDAMGGKIGFDSQPGQNAAFWIWLPRSTTNAIAVNYPAVAIA